MSALLDKILSRSNMLEAYNQVKANKGSADIDGIRIDQIDGYLRQHWRPTKELIKQRQYKRHSQFYELKFPSLMGEFVSLEYQQ